MGANLYVISDAVLLKMKILNKLHLYLEII